MFSRFFLPALSLCLLVGQATAFHFAPTASWKDCLPGSPCKPESVAIKPDPPTKHTNITGTGKAVCDVAIPSGTFDAIITADGLPVVVKKNLDLCADHTIPLPLGQGTFYLFGLPVSTFESI